MKKFFCLLFLSFFIISCNDVLNNPAKNRNDNAASGISNNISNNIVCNYKEYKKRSYQLYKQYLNQPDSSTKNKLLINIRDSPFTCWLGTPWDFNGTTEEPGKGKIACGYFVTTILRDMGVPVNRIKHAQCASEVVIRAICMKNSIRRFSNENILSFVQKIKFSGTGLYIVGLDFHTGFILNDGKEVYFIHANYLGRKVVSKEKAIESAALSSSKYREIGKVI